MKKYEHRTHYDAHGTGNYTENKEDRVSFEITEEKAKQFINFWTATGCKHYETSHAHHYEKHTDSRHITEYIIYK